MQHTNATMTLSLLVFHVHVIDQESCCCKAGAEIWQCTRETATGFFFFWKKFLNMLCFIVDSVSHGLVFLLNCFELQLCRNQTRKTRSSTYGTHLKKRAWVHSGVGGDCTMFPEMCCTFGRKLYNRLFLVQRFEMRQTSCFARRCLMRSNIYDQLGHTDTQLCVSWLKFDAARAHSWATRLHIRGSTRCCEEVGFVSRVHRLSGEVRSVTAALKVEEEVQEEAQEIEDEWGEEVVGWNGELKVEEKRSLHVWTWDDAHKSNLSHDVVFKIMTTRTWLLDYTHMGSRVHHSRVEVHVCCVEGALGLGGHVVIGVCASCRSVSPRRRNTKFRVLSFWIL